MNLIVLAACFLFVFCQPRHQHHRAGQAQTHEQSPATVQDEPSVQQRDARGKSCEQITEGFESWEKSDNLVAQFPVKQQRRVLLCLDAKRTGGK